MKIFNSKIVLFFTCLTFLFPIKARGENPTVEWINQFNGPGNGLDIANDMEMDAFGNIYVTGHTYSGAETTNDYVTIKYDASGNELWTRTYSGPRPYGFDYPVAIAVDASGNAYVTGKSPGIGTNQDIATIKYDTNGNELWVRRYSGAGSDSNEYVSGIAVDSAGNVFITGKTNADIQTLYDFVTIKYDSNGNELWVKTYSGSASYSSDARAIAVDAAGNAYVTGISVENGTDEDLTTIKYDPNGNELWVRNYNRIDTSKERAVGMTLDAIGNVYVACYSFYNNAGSIIAVKYDTDGNEQWVGVYPENNDDGSLAIGVDALGNVYIAATWSGNNNSYDDFHTLKFDTNGNLAWSRLYNGPANKGDRAIDLAVNAAGNVYVVGESYTSDVNTWVYATVKYDTDGNQLWVMEYSRSGSLDCDYPTAVVVDKVGNVYVTGQSGIYDDITTIKYNDCDSQGVTGTISPSVTTLWPPNHDIVPVSIDISNLIQHNPNQTQSITITSVSVSEFSSQEASEAYGENTYDPNNFEPDVEITGDLTLNLRSERSGASTGRTYTITVTATDCSGSYTFTTEVVVPHDKQ